MELSYHSLHDTRHIRENITPIGDGNFKLLYFYLAESIGLIRENITPIGDGNSIVCHKYASKVFSVTISENITPIGDGNDTNINH